MLSILILEDLDLQRTQYVLVHDYFLERACLMDVKSIFVEMGFKMLTLRTPLLSKPNCGKQMHLLTANYDFD